MKGSTYRVNRFFDHTLQESGENGNIKVVGETITLFRLCNRDSAYPLPFSAWRYAHSQQKRGHKRTEHDAYDWFSPTVLSPQYGESTAQQFAVAGTGLQGGRISLQQLSKLRIDATK